MTTFIVYFSQNYNPGRIYSIMYTIDDLRDDCFLEEGATHDWGPHGYNIGTPPAHKAGMALETVMPQSHPLSYLRIGGRFQWEFISSFCIPSGRRWVSESLLLEEYDVVFTDGGVEKKLFPINVHWSFWRFNLCLKLDTHTQSARSRGCHLTQPDTFRALFQALFGNFT